MKISSLNFIFIVAITGSYVKEVWKFYEVYFYPLEKGKNTMKTFADKVKESRETLGLSQGALAEKVNVSQRSITAYETGSAKPRGTTARKLAHALNVSLDYLLNDETEDPKSGIEKDSYLANIHDLYGARGEEEAKALLDQNMALFAGGGLSQEAKDAFFESIMTAYVTCKEEARKTYGHKNTEK